MTVEHLLNIKQIYIKQATVALLLFQNVNFIHKQKLEIYYIKVECLLILLTYAWNGTTNWLDM